MNPYRLFQLYWDSYWICANAGYNYWRRLARYPAPRIPEKGPSQATI